jgi:hypothetical protein
VRGALSAVCVLLAFSDSAAGTLPPPRYTGAYWGLEAGAGLARAPDDDSLHLRLGARFSSLLQVGDLAVQYGLSGVDGGQLHRATVSGQLHPFFFFMLTGEGLWQSLAAVYVRLGLGAGVEQRADGDATALMLWDWGAGFDLPVTEPDDGRSLWLGLEYLRTSGLDEDPVNRPVLQDVLLRVGWRINVL